jgi:hypothetical protein
MSHDHPLNEKSELALANDLKGQPIMNTMLKTVLVTGGLILALTLPARATLIAAWDFPALQAAPGTPATFTATVGTGSLDVSAFASTVTNPERTMFGGTTLNAFTGGDAGTTAALALANNSANGKSIIFSLDMSLYQNLVLSFVTRGTATGFNNQQWAYSNDGTSYTAFGANTADNTATFVTKSIDFSSITALNGDSSIFIQLTVNGASSASGNNRFDNIQFNADLAGVTAVPEASTWYAGIGLSLGMLISFVRKIRK